MNNQKKVSINPTLSWLAVPDVTISSQAVVVATDAGLQNIVADLTASGNSVQITGLENDTVYYWRVDTVGSDNIGTVVCDGPVWSFKTHSNVCNIGADEGDLNNDCIVDMLDFAIMYGNWLDSDIYY